MRKHWSSDPEGAGKDPDPGGSAAPVASPPLVATAPRRSRAIYLLVVCGLLLSAAVIAGSAWLIADLRSRALAASGRELRNTALILAEQTDRAIQAVELMQNDLIERVRALGIVSAGDFERAMSGHSVHHMLKEKAGGWPHIGSITLINSNGKLFNFSRFWPLPEIDVTDREFYRALKSDPTLTSFMGEPVRNRATGSWTIHLVRKVTGPDGEFLGLILGAMEMSYFDQFFGTVALGGSGRIRLFRDDGVLLAAHPLIDPLLARNLGDKALFQDMWAGAQAGTLQRVQSVAGHDRQVVAQKLAHYPFLLTTSRTVEDALAEWRSATLYIGGAALLLLLVIGIAVWLSTRQIKSYELLVKARMEGDQRIQLDATINNMTQGLLMFDAAERMVVCNRRYIEMYGLSPDVVKPGCAFRELIAHRKQTGSFSGDIDDYHRALRTSLAEGVVTDRIVQTNDGRSIRIIDHPMVNGGWVATHEDITEALRSRTELERTQAFLHTVIENVPSTIFVKEVEGQRYLLVNRAFEQLWGIPREQVIGKSAYHLFAERVADQFFERDMQLIERPGQLLHTTYQIETPDNGHRLVESRRIAITGEGGKPEYLLGVVEDITERVRADERIRYMAHHDLLTGLSNRALFMEKIEEAGARLRRRGETFTVFMLDLDRFKFVNDSLGHPEGDSLLKETARRLKCALRETDVLARLGGDEFAILQAGESEQRADAARLADQIMQVIAEPYDIGGSKVTVGTSIGIAVAPEDGIEPGELMKKADLALYRMKSEGRNGYRFFDAQMTADAVALHQLEHDLREAIRHNQLEVYYQPIVSGTTRQPVGAEALLRWRHPKRGFIPPDQFIPLAEETGLIVPLGEWVLQTACAAATTWPSHLKVSVNLSPVQFRKGNLLDVIMLVLVETGLPPDRLELEITESMLIENELDIGGVLGQVRNMGVSVALDDFGTGYSSLSYLTKFPFDKIKIDKSFTQNMIKRAECRAIVSSVRALGTGLDILTTAEGVETEQQFEMLRAAGIDLVQGYLFGRPSRASELDPRWFGAVVSMPAARSA
jgi:diguanylate cyclase (GGDEF)-like protein/PAS domain S-box-containing protein